MASFFGEILNDLKQDLKQEIRTETRGLTKDAIRGAKESFKNDNKGENNNVVQQPTQQVVQPQTQEVVQQPTQQPVIQQPIQQEVQSVAQQQIVQQPVQQVVPQQYVNQVVQPVNTVQQVIPQQPVYVVQQPTNQIAQPVYVVQQPIQQQIAQPISTVEQRISNGIDPNEKFLGKTVDEYREIFQSLKNKHGEDVAGIINDPEFQQLDADSKEYLNRVYMPTIQSTAETLTEAHKELANSMEGAGNDAQALYDKYNKDGVITPEEENELNKVALSVIGQEFNNMGAIAPKYMDKFGDMANDLSGRVENKELAGEFQKLGNAFKNSEYQSEVQNEFSNMKDAYKNLEDLPEKVSNMENIVNDSMINYKENAQKMQNDVKVAAEAVGMTQEDVKNSINEGANLDANTVANQTQNSIAKLQEVAQTGNEEEIKDATKETLDSALKTFGSLFGGRS